MDQRNLHPQQPHHQMTPPMAAYASPVVAIPQPTTAAPPPPPPFQGQVGMPNFPPTALHQQQQQQQQPMMTHLPQGAVMVSRPHPQPQPPQYPFAPQQAPAPQQLPPPTASQSASGSSSPLQQTSDLVPSMVTAQPSIVMQQQQQQPTAPSVAPIAPVVNQTSSMVIISQGSNSNLSSATHSRTGSDEGSGDDRHRRSLAATTATAATTPSHPAVFNIPDPTAPQSIYCRDFCAGKCTRDPKDCRYLHPPPGWCPIPSQVCKDYKVGKCKRAYCRHFHGSQQELTELIRTGQPLYFPKATGGVPATAVNLNTQGGYPQQQQQHPTATTTAIIPGGAVPGTGAAPPSPVFMTTATPPLPPPPPYGASPLGSPGGPGPTMVTTPPNVSIPVFASPNPPSHILTRADSGRDLMAASSGSGLNSPMGGSTGSMPGSMVLVPMTP